MGYLKATKNGVSHKFSTLSKDYTGENVFPPIMSYQGVNARIATIRKIILKPDRTYYIIAKFRTRGNGNSDSENCSSLHFFCNSSIHYYNYSLYEISKIGELRTISYSFTVNSDTTVDDYKFGFFFGNYNGSGYGLGDSNDNQTIDIYYYKIYDSLGNVYLESSTNGSNIVKKWSDGTSIYNAKTLSNTTTSEKYLYSEIINPNYMVEGETYTIVFDAMISGDVKGVDMYFLSSDYSTTGFITSKTSLDVITEYKHFSHTFIFSKKNASSNLPNLRIRFDNNGVVTSGNTGTLYIKDVELKRGKIENPAFLNLTKNDDVRFCKIYSDNGAIKINNSYYLKEGMSEKKYSEINDINYTDLKSYFVY